MSNFESGLLVLAIVHLLAYSGLHFYLLRGFKRIEPLSEVPLPDEPDALPCLSVVVAARNEQESIEATLLSLLELDYPRLEVIVVNDRSTDATGEVIQRVEARCPELVHIVIQSLPEDWLGKNHAMQVGAERAAGEWILFTDADVLFQADAVSRAVGFAIEQRLDHLAALPRVRMPGLLLESFMVMFARFFMLYFKPWNAPRAESDAHVGVGAFNLVRAESYRAAGSHEPIRMRPDDDVQLGKLMKKHGFRSQLVDAVQHVSVTWYSSLGELIRGLEKNALAGVDYRPSRIVLAVGALICFYFWPFVAVFVLPSPACWIYLGLCGMMLLSKAQTAIWLKLRWWAMLLLPLGVLLFAYILARNVLLTYWRGGIQWRGTHYSLKQLRANKS